MSGPSKALASLTATYTDSEGEDGVEDNFEDSNTPKGVVSQNDDSQIYASSRSNSSSSNSPINSSILSGKNNVSASNSTFGTDSNKVQRLVSYFDDTIASDDESTVLTTSTEPLPINGKSSVEEMEQQSPERPENLSDDEADAYGVVIPPEPPGKCPTELQDKITGLYKKMELGRSDMNKMIQQRKDFRNPSIYEKLIQFCNINELGTNYPPERFDPFKWGKDSYYEELAKVQKIEMEKLEKARKEKTKIEIVSGTAKRPNAAPPSTEDDAKKRKSKWDQVSATTAAAAAAAAAKLPTVTQTTLTLTATGTKTTLISAFGSLPKKRL